MSWKTTVSLMLTLTSGIIGAIWLPIVAVIGCVLAIVVASLSLKNPKNDKSSAITALIFASVGFFIATLLHQMRDFPL